MPRRNQYRPGPGWRHIGSGVCEYFNGMRAHPYGLLVHGPLTVYGCHWPESKTLDRFVRINGGNRRRGVMAWAKNFIARLEGQSHA